MSVFNESQRLEGNSLTLHQGFYVKKHSAYQSKPQIGAMTERSIHISTNWDEADSNSESIRRDSEAVFKNGAS